MQNSILKLFFLFAWIQLIGLAESRAQEVPLEYYGIEEGLPELRIDHLRVLENGTLFIATKGVPSVYDGYEFRNVYHEHKENRYWLINSAKGHDGTIWFTDIRCFLFGFDGTKMFLHPVADSMGRLANTKGRHISIAFDSLNTAYIGLNGRGHYVKAFQDGSVERVPTSVAYKANSAYIDGRFTSKPFYGSTPKDNSDSQGHLYIDGEIVKSFEYPLKGRVQYVERSSLKVISVGKSLFFIEGGQLREQHFEQEINTMLFDNHGKLWIGFGAGAGYIDFRNSGHFEPVIVDRMVTSFAIDNEEHLWIGTTNGLYKILSPFITNYFEGSGKPLATESPPVIVTIANKVVVLGQSDFFALNGTRFELTDAYRFPRFPGDIRQGHNGAWTFVTSGIHHINDIKRSSTLPIRGVSGLFVSNDSTVWFTRGSFLEQIDNKGNLLTSVRTDTISWEVDMPESAYIRMAGIDNGIPCISKNAILFAYKNGRFEMVYREANGKRLLYPNCIENHGPLTLIGTKVSGLWVLHSDTFYHLGIHNGLVSDHIRSVVIENDSTWWLATNKGVQKVTFHLDDKDFRYKAQVVDKTSGLPSSSISSLSLHHDTLWCCTRSGVSSISLDIFNAHAKAPPISKVSWLKVNDRDTFFTHPLELNHHQNQLTFGFKAVTFKPTSRKKYKYRLIGENSEWRTTTDTMISYSSLPAGDFIFEVRTWREGNTSISPPSKVSFSISKPIWRRTWFIATIILLAQLIAGLGVWLMNRSKRRRLSLEKNVLTAELKALRAQLNPHFMFNALGAIQGSVMEGSTDNTLQNIGKLAHLMRKMLYATRNKRTTLKETLEVLKLYLDLELVRQPDKFTYDIEYDQSCEDEMETINIPPSIIQPFVENAVLHGASKADNKGLIKVKFEQFKGYIKCEISDNGPGYYKSQKQKKGQHRSLGMSIVKEQIDLLNMDLESKITLKIEERMGTIVTVMMPVNF